MNKNDIEKILNEQTIEFVKFKDKIEATIVKKDAILI